MVRRMNFWLANNMDKTLILIGQQASCHIAPVETKLCMFWPCLETHSTLCDCCRKSLLFFCCTLYILVIEHNFVFSWINRKNNNTMGSYGLAPLILYWHHWLYIAVVECSYSATVITQSWWRGAEFWCWNFLMLIVWFSAISFPCLFPMFPMSCDTENLVFSVPSSSCHCTDVVFVMDCAVLLWCGVSWYICIYIYIYM